MAGEALGRKQRFLKGVTMENLISKMVDSLIKDILGILSDMAFLLAALLILIILAYAFIYLVKNMVFKKKE
jgi:hypothetical protein